MVQIIEALDEKRRILALLEEIRLSVPSFAIAGRIESEIASLRCDITALTDELSDFEAAAESNRVALTIYDVMEVAA